MRILELCSLNHKYSLDKNNLFIERSPVFLRPSVEVASETGALGLFLFLLYLCPDL